ncbi:hypothetical protein CR513_27687, partial [Mucuna pruriens]
MRDTKWVQSRLDQLNLIEEKQLTTLYHGQLYQRRIKNAFHKKVRPHRFKGDLVIRKILHNVKDPRGKWTTNYEGPYVVRNAFSRGALILVDSEGQELQHPVNIDMANLFHPLKLNQGRIQRADPRVSKRKELAPPRIRLKVSPDLQTQKSNGIPQEGITGEGKTSSPSTSSTNSDTTPGQNLRKSTLGSQVRPDDMRLSKSKGHPTKHWRLRRRHCALRENSYAHNKTR